jgi:hypothetical protein
MDRPAVMTEHEKADLQRRIAVARRIVVLAGSLRSQEMEHAHSL